MVVQDDSNLEPVLLVVTTTIIESCNSEKKILGTGFSNHMTVNKNWLRESQQQNASSGLTANRGTSSIHSY